MENGAGDPEDIQVISLYMWIRLIVLYLLISVGFFAARGISPGGRRGLFTADICSWR
jgi:hypothetical protein